MQFLIDKHKTAVRFIPGPLFNCDFSLSSGTISVSQVRRRLIREYFHGIGFPHCLRLY